uniref:MUN domain-containing protein n=1 Tax=Timema genevievae TaxID=629358 RepID=A0A7R9JSU9_TIMGE|nr:unnamed protein product [Timema genevievae]
MHIVVTSSAWPVQAQSSSCQDAREASTSFYAIPGLTPSTPLSPFVSLTLCGHVSSPETRVEEIEPSIREPYPSELDLKPNREGLTSPKAYRCENHSPFVPRVESHEKGSIPESHPPQRVEISPQQWYTAQIQLLCNFLSERLDHSLHLYQCTCLAHVVKSIISIPLLKLFVNPHSPADIALLQQLIGEGTKPMP